jgi:hypothetical protein
MGGAQVWESYQRGEIGAIRNYCETDVANTYLVFLRFQLTRGALARDAYEHEIDLVRQTLARSAAQHWQQFVAAWQAREAPASDPHPTAG